MKRLLPALLALAVNAAIVACTKGSSEPVAPPGSLGPSVNPRFDGSYTRVVSGTDGGRDMIRFADDGKVFGISAATKGVVERAYGMLKDGNEKCARGTWAVKDGILRFVLRSGAGTVEYAGAVQGDRLNVRWRSDINGASVENEYAFNVRDVVPGQASTPPPAAEKDAGGGNDGGADGGADAGAAEPEPPSAGTLVPEGNGWYCFRAGAGSRCERKQASCDAARRTAAAVRKDAKAAKCARQTNAWCFTVQRVAGMGAASCAASEGDCDADRASVTSETSAADVTVSACTKQ